VLNFAESLRKIKTMKEAINLATRKLLIIMTINFSMIYVDKNQSVGLG